MKKILTMAMIIALAMIITSCDQPVSSSDNSTLSVFSKEYWGEWVRMDTGESWIITDNAITARTSAADASPVRVTSLAKQSERVIKANSAGEEIYLFAARIANSRFTGKINIEGGAGSPQSSVVPGISRSATSGSGGITVTVTNKNNPSLTATTTTDAEGNFAVEEIIPGDEYTVAAGGQTAPVLPTAPDVDVGTITLTSGINFKTTIAPASGNTTDMMQMYAKKSAHDSGHRYSFVISVHNTGTERVEAAPFSLTPDEGLTILSKPGYPILGTILPGASKEIPITVACEPLETEDNVLKRISITLRGVDKIWNDAVSLRFNKQPVTFYIAAKSPVQGVIITPYSKAYQFSTNKISPSYDNSYVTSITLPWSKQDYLAVFSGATLATETSYSFGANTRPSVVWNQGGGLYAVEGEPANDTETGAVILLTSQWHMGYLHEEDIDFYKIRLGDTLPADLPSDIFSDARDVLTVTGTTSSSVTLSWLSVSNASQYRVERSASSSFSSVTTNTVSGTSYTASGLDPSITYYFRVKALNSSDIVISTMGPVTATTDSSSLSGLTVTGTTSSTVSLSWSSVSGASQYRVERSTSSSFSTVTTNTVSGTSYTVSGLSSGTAYHFRITALNQYGYAIGTARTISATTDGSSLSDLTVTNTTLSSVSLSWPSASDASQYRVERSASSSFSSVTTNMTSGTSYTASGLSSGTTYYFRVTALNQSGYMISVSTISATTDHPPLSGLTVTSTTTSSITLSWTGLSGASYYRVERAASSPSSFVTTNMTSGTSYTASGLSSGTAYYFWVTALNQYGDAISTAEIISATTDSSSSEPITLSSSTWYDNVISSGETHTYQFYASSDTTYYIKWNDSYSGDDLKTADVVVSAVSPSGSSLFSNQDDGYDSFGQPVSVTSSGYVTITVTPYSYSSGGTYAIIYYYY